MIISKEKVVDDKQASLTVTKFEQSAPERKKESIFLQEAKEQGSDEENDDADVNAESNKVDEDDKNMIISIEEEHNTLEYQKTMKVDVENNPKTK